MQNKQKIILTGHQPVYLPWLGLFHKTALSDIFIFMDDVQYLAQDWNNRNKIKTPHGEKWLIVPISKKSPSMLLKDILIDSSRAKTKDDWQLNHWKTIETSYKRAVFFKDYAAQVEKIYLGQTWEKLSDLNEAQLKLFLEFLGIKVEFHRASELGFTQKKSDLVLEHCLRFQADVCITGTFGKDYIQLVDFQKNNIKVHFQQYHHPTYTQLWGEFIPNLSVIDLIFNHGTKSRDILMQNNVTQEEILKEITVVES